MPKFDITVPHTLEKQDAVERLKSFSDRLKEQFSDKVKDIEQSWDGDTLSFAFKTLGLTIGGKMDVRDDAVAVNGDLPFAAAMFKGQITSSIENQLTKILRG